MVIIKKQKQILPEGYEVST